MPVLEADGKIFNHSMPICRYLGNEFGLVGSNALENYEIDAAAETVNELRGSKSRADKRREQILVDEWLIR